ncbi:MAG: hypothetical protein OEW87_09405 [Flavobacteriaceae bacterium]|nr:hypothetical protein [Flavobacteriaceae bacterium]
MSADNLLLRRHVYKEVGASFFSTNLNILMPAIESVNEYIRCAQHLDVVDDSVTIYFDRSKTMMVGREVIGFDTQIQYHDDLKIHDYSEQEIIAQKDCFIESYQQLQEMVESDFKNNDFEVCRVKTNTFSQFKIMYLK